MTKLITAYILTILLFFSTKEQTKNKLIVPTTENTDRKTLLTEKEFYFANTRQIAGIYKYIYPHSTKDLIENHYIKLEEINDKISGFYFGTSDDFDEMREGNLPGFFKAKMLNLKLKNLTIEFNIKVKMSDIFTKAITPFDNPKNKKLWTIGLRHNDRDYSGKIIGDTIIIKTVDEDPRLFIKIDK